LWALLLIVGGALLLLLLAFLLALTLALFHGRHELVDGHGTAHIEAGLLRQAFDHEALATFELVGIDHPVAVGIEATKELGAIEATLAAAELIAAPLLAARDTSTVTDSAPKTSSTACILLETALTTAKFAAPLGQRAVRNRHGG
jgi:hypothetical protein